MSDIHRNIMEERFEDFKEQRLCAKVFDVPYEQRCQFVHETESCIRSVTFLDYVQVFVCKMNIHRRRDEIKMIGLFLVILLTCFVIIATVANEYYAPAMKVVARLLHMNEHLAGVTILALGNASAHVLEHLLHIGENQHIFTNSMAFSLFGILVPGGLLCYLSPFEMNAYATARDLLFFMLGTQLMQVCIINLSITRFHCFGLMLYYCVYIVVVLVDNYLVNKTIKDVKFRLNELRMRAHRERLMERVLERKLEELERDAEVPLKAARRSKKFLRRFSFLTHRDDKPNPYYVSVGATRRAFHNSNEPRNRFLFIDFLEEITPIDRLSWRTGDFWTRVGLILKVPINLLCRIYIPRIDMEDNRHAWSKLLNCIQILITPSISLVLITTLFHTYETWHIQFNFKYMLYPLPVTSVIAIVVFFTSRTDLPPRYHCMFAFMSIFTSILVIFLCVSETVAVIDMLGNLIGLSSDFMGATLGALSAQIGDIAINLAMSRHGYPQMAFAATLGGPFFNLIFATSFTFVAKAISSGKNKAKLDPGLYGETCFIFIILAIISTFIWTTILNFQSRRSVGIFNLCLYGAYCIMAVLTEAELIHTFQTDAHISFPEI